MATLIPVRGRIKEVPVIPDFGTNKFSIEQIQKFVGPTFQVVQARHVGQGVFYVATVDGYDDGLPLNVAASYESRHALYGDVLVAKFEELGGEESAT